MKKIIKYSFFGLIYLFIVFILAIIFLKEADAEIIKPNNGIEPYQVVKIVLRGLKNNDIPKKENGIEQTWEFAHPNNKAITGPLDKFKKMIYSESYKILISHQSTEITILKETKDISVYKVTVLTKNKKKYYYIWQVEKVLSEGKLKRSGEKVYSIYPSSSEMPEERYI